MLQFVPSLSGTLRFDPSTVVDLYRERGMKPIRWAFTSKGRCGCLMAALYATDDEAENSCVDADTLNERAYADGLSATYVHGLVHGFDDNGYQDFRSMEFDAGFEDGRQSFENLLAAEMI